MQQNKKYFVIILILMCVTSNISIAQEQDSFSEKINRVSIQIDSIVGQNKKLLKEEIDSIEDKRASKQITLEEYDSLKINRATFYAIQIEKDIAEKEKDIKDIIQQKIDGNLKPNSGLLQNLEEELSEKRTMIDVSYNFGLNGVNDKNSQFEISVMFSFEILGRTKLWLNNPHYFISYGVGFNGNYLKPKNNLILEENGNQTFLVESDKHLKESRIDILSYRFPVMFEYDFAKSSNSKSINSKIPDLNSRQSFFIGLGGYIGFMGHKNMTQLIRYEENGKEYIDRHSGNRNVNKFLYGINAQIGYKSLSVFFDYQLSPIFQSNPTNQNIYTIGVKLSLFNVLVN